MASSSSELCKCTCWPLTSRELLTSSLATRCGQSSSVNSTRRCGFRMVHCPEKSNDRRLSRSMATERIRVRPCRNSGVSAADLRENQLSSTYNVLVETQLKSRPSIADQPGNHTTHCTQNSDAGVLRPVAALSAPPVTTTTSTAPGEREVTVPSRHSSPGGNTGNASAPQSLPRSLQSNGNGGRGVRRNPANRIPLSLVPDIGEAIVNYQPPSNGGSVRLHNQTAVNDGRASYHRRTQSANTSPTTVQRDQDMESGLRDLLSCMEQINVMSQLPVCSICGRRHLPNDPNLRTVWLILMMGAQLASVTYANAERHGPEAPATIEVDEQRMDPRLAGFYTRLTTVQRISLLGIFALFASVVAIMIPWPLTAG